MPFALRKRYAAIQCKYRRSNDENPSLFFHGASFMCFAPAAQTVRGASSSPSAHYSGSIKDPIVGLNLVFVKDGVLERTWPVVQASPMLDSHRITTDYKRYHSAYYR